MALLTRIWSRRDRRSNLLRHLLIGLLLLVCGGAMGEFFLSGHARSQEKLLLDRRLATFATSFEAARQHFDKLSNFLIAEVLATPGLIEGMAAYADARSEEERKGIRTALKERLDPLYGRMRSRGIKQLHLHTPESDSMLRMHSPEKFGDSLKGIRATVELANAEKRKVTAFEEGRIFNGLRYVFPVSGNGNHLGTIETSFSTMAIQEYCTKLVPDTRFNFLINREVVEEKVFESDRHHYREWDYSEDFLVEANAFVDTPELLHGFREMDRDRMANLINREIRQVTNHANPAIRYLSGIGNGQIFAYLPISNLKGRHVAAMVGLQSGEEIAGMKTQNSRLRFGMWLVLFGASAVFAIALHGWNAAREENRSALQRLQKLSENLPGMLYQFQHWQETGKSVFPFATEGIRQIYEVSPEEVSQDATPVYDRLHPEDRDSVIRKILESAATLKPWYDEYRVLFPDGRVEWLQGYSTPEKLEDGSILWHGYITQITARKAEEMKIREEEEITRFILEEAIGGYWDWNIPANTEYMSPRFKAMFGYSEEEMPNVPESWMKIIHPDDLQVMLQLFEEHVQSHGTVPFRPEVRFTHKDGRTIWVICSGRIIRWDDEGNPVRMVGCHVDISPQMEAEARLQKTNQELAAATHEAQKANKAKSAFLATMSHEIRTPLNAIIGMSSILMDSRLQEEEKEFVQTISRSADSLLLLISDLLDYSKIEADRLELESAPFNLLDGILAPMEFVAKQAADKELDLCYQIDPATPSILIGDIARIKQVLLNLLSNAVKFTERGSVTLEVKCHEKEPNRWNLQIAVTDTGIGMDEETISRLFQPFVQGDSSITRRFGGTGLGLAISRKLIEGMGGSITVESSPGNGSVFRIYVPMESVENCPTVFQASPTDRLRGKSALLFSRHAMTRNLIGNWLAAWGVELKPETLSLDALLDSPDPAGVDFFIVESEVLRGTGRLDMRSVVSQLSRHAHRICILQRDPAERLEFQIPGSKVANAYPPIRPSQLVAALDSDLAGDNSGKPHSPSVKFRKLRILTVDDNSINQRVFQVSLEQMGHHVDSASNGEVALSRVKASPYDLVFMDVEMPVMDGLTATRRIRNEMPANRRPLIIALTANALPHHRKVCFDAGMDDYLAKPIRPTQLAQIIQKHFKLEAPGESHAPDSRTPEIPGPAGESDLLNRTQLNSILDTLPKEIHSGFLEELIANSETSLQEGLQSLHAAWEAGDAERQRFVLHKIKGSAGATGMQPLSEFIQSMESGNPQAEDLRKIAELMDSSLREFRKFAESAKEKAEGLKKA